MAGIWVLTNAVDTQLYCGDIVRLQPRHDGESDEVRSGHRWADGMPEILERWHIEDIRNGWITLHQARLGDIWRETGVIKKVRRNRRALFMMCLAPGDEYDAARLPEWARTAA
ncbi:hypothetical protein AB0N09_28135 [Streptomyces erythrochromogenes]|uniref:hypothetical protein n=1 Tax=Streptomyces erythrochromogenes TaxID=285574 RepID=UPI00342062C4